MKIQLFLAAIFSHIPQIKGRHWWLSVVTWMILLAPAQASVILRVAIERDVEQVKIGSSTTAVVKDASGKTLGELPKMKAYYAQPTSGGGVALDKWRSGLFWIEPSGKGFVYIGDKWYRGRTLVLPTQKGLTAVNWVDLEEYLYSVIGGEMNPNWHPEALKAQAIAARTYALYERQRQRGNPIYDVGDTPDRWQIYEGVKKETPNIYAAVDSTKGQVLTYNNKPILSVFHACSGGHTENVEDVWGNSLPYLRGVPGYDGNVKGFYKRKCEWTKSFSPDQISAKFPSVGEVEEIKVEERSPYQSVTALKIIGDKGTEILKGEKVRTALKLNSTRFTVNKTSDGNFVLQGRGWGHGLGMSQLGAFNLASQEVDHLRILGHYYGQKVFLTKIKLKK